jgi:hypothetical protein
MKRMYLTPESIVIDLESSGMLCSSPLDGEFGDDATTPAKGRGFYGDWDDEE